MMHTHLIPSFLLSNAIVLLGFWIQNGAELTGLLVNSLARWRQMQSVHKSRENGHFPKLRSETFPKQVDFDQKALKISLNKPDRFFSRPNPKWPRVIFIQDQFGCLQEWFAIFLLGRSKISRLLWHGRIRSLRRGVRHPGWRRRSSSGSDRKAFDPVRRRGHHHGRHRRLPPKIHRVDQSYPKKLALFSATLNTSARVLLFDSLLILPS